MLVVSQIIKSFMEETKTLIETILISDHETKEDNVSHLTEAGLLKTNKQRDHFW